MKKTTASIYAAVLATLALAPAAQADTFKWVSINAQGGGTYDWEEPSNWLKTGGGGTHDYPHLAGDIADLTETWNAAGEYQDRLTLHLDSEVRLGVFHHRKHLTIENLGAGRIVMDNNGAVAEIRPLTNLSGPASFINVPVEIIGRAELIESNLWQTAYAGGFVGDADSVVTFLGQGPEGEISLMNNSRFHGEFRNLRHTHAWRSTVTLASPDAIGSAKIFNNSSAQTPGALRIMAPLPAGAFDRLSINDQSAVVLEGDGHLVNATQAQLDRLVPFRGFLLFHSGSPLGERWPADKDMNLLNTHFNIIHGAEQRLGKVTSAGAAFYRNDVAAPDQPVWAGMGLKRGGSFSFEVNVPYVDIGETGAALDDVLPPEWRWTLDNAATVIVSRVGFHSYGGNYVAAKVMGSAAPWRIVPVEDADYVPLDGITTASNVFATLTDHTWLAEDKKIAALNFSRELYNDNHATPTVTLTKGLLTAAGGASFQPNLVFGESENERVDGVILNQWGGGGSYMRLQMPNVYARDLYLVTSGPYYIIHDTRFHLEGELFINFSNDTNVQFWDSLRGLENTVVNVNSPVNGKVHFHNGMIGGLRGSAGWVTGFVHNGLATLAISNTVDCVFTGGVHDFTDHGEMRTLKLRKLGLGTQTFTGPVTATKGIDIEEGVLRLDGTVSREELVFIGAQNGFPGGVLAGTGSVGTNTVLATGGTIAPAGTGETGTLSFTGVFAATGGEIEIELASPNDFDRIFVDGDADLGAAQIVVKLLGGYTPASKTVFPIVTAAGLFDTAGLPNVKGYKLWREGETLCLSIVPGGTMLMVR